MGDSLYPWFAKPIRTWPHGLTDKQTKVTSLSRSRPDSELSHRATRLRASVGKVDLVAVESTRAFPRHSHDQFGIGLIDRGAQISASGRGRVEAHAGQIICVNPGEVHDGAPVGPQGRSWRMIYLDPAVVTTAIADVTEVAASGGEFTRPALRSEPLARVFETAFAAAQADAAEGHDAFEESLLILVKRLVGVDEKVHRGVPAGIARVRQLIDDDPACGASLVELASLAGLSRFQLVRSFALHSGLTPHAYRVQARTHLARRLIASGLPIAQAAVDAGFADQSHMSRAFGSIYGLTPGTYKAGRPAAQ